MRQREPETATFDPITLSLALWLGLMVGALGLQRMSEEAAAQQAAQQATAQPSASTNFRPAHLASVQAFTPWNR